MRAAGGHDAVGQVPRTLPCERVPDWRRMESAGAVQSQLARRTQVRAAKNRKNKEFFLKSLELAPIIDIVRVATPNNLQARPRLARTASLEDQFEPNFERSRPPFVVFCRLKSPSSSREHVEMTARRSGSDV